jgi:hypothetical protein
MVVTTKSLRYTSNTLYVDVDTYVAYPMYTGMFELQLLT